MSKTVKLLALLLLAGGMLAGCNKIGLGGGGRVVFVASSESSATRTSYSGVVDSDTKIERIDWVANDKLTIWSDKARTTDNQPTADYKVGAITTSGSISKASVTSVDANGLQWGNGTHTFYARYPNDATKIDGDYMSGEIPSSQVLTWGASGSADEFIGKPSMANAFMFAKAMENPDAESVVLQFSPKFTAFQFTIGCGENPEVTLTSFKLKSATKALAGAFQVVCSSGVVSSTSTNKEITVNLGKTISGTETLTFTVFALAKENLTDLSIEFSGTPIGNRKLALKDKNGNSVSFAPEKKHVLTGFSFPILLTATGEDIDWDIEALLESMIWD